MASIANANPFLYFLSAPWDSAKVKYYLFSIRFTDYGFLSDILAVILVGNLVGTIQVLHPSFAKIPIKSHYKIILLRPELNITACLITKILDSFKSGCKGFHIL